MNGPTVRDPGAATAELEVELLLEALLQRFGYDFRAYERAAVTAKLYAVMAENELATLSRLQDRVLHQAGAGEALLRALSVQPYQMFDQPEQARLLRIVLASSLRASAVPKVWLAECTSAEEAWSLAILLAEQQLDSRTEIFATLANEELLAEAAQAFIPMARMADCVDRYRESGGNARLEDYFDIDGERAVLLPHLRQRITWAQYNLVTDASFNEFQMIVCPRALGEFGPPLRARTLRLFHDSLSLFGVLGLDRPLDAGDPLAVCYQPVFADQCWYKRIA